MKTTIIGVLAGIAAGSALYIATINPMARDLATARAERATIAKTLAATEQEREALHAQMEEAAGLMETIGKQLLAAREETDACRQDYLRERSVSDAYWRAGLSRGIDVDQMTKGNQ